MTSSKTQFESSDIGPVFGLGMFCGFILTAVAGAFILAQEQGKTATLKEEAINRGVAGYHVKTGEWQWIDPKPIYVEKE